jgi:hypothetical protein
VLGIGDGAVIALATGVPALTGVAMGEASGVTCAAILRAGAPAIANAAAPAASATARRREYLAE